MKTVDIVFFVTIFVILIGGLIYYQLFPPRQRTEEEEKELAQIYEDIARTKFWTRTIALIAIIVFGIIYMIANL